MILAIRRRGTFRLQHDRNYCGKRGPVTVHYRVLVVGSKLDKRGFLVSHEDIHRLLEEKFKWTFTGSCEKLVQQAVAAIRAKWPQLVRVRVQLSGDPKVAWVSANWRRHA